MRDKRLDNIHRELLRERYDRATEWAELGREQETFLSREAARGIGIGVAVGAVVYLGVWGVIELIRRWL